MPFCFGPSFWTTHVHAHTHPHTVCLIHTQRYPRRKLNFSQSFQDSDAYLINVYSYSHCTDSQGSKWYLMRKKEATSKEKIKLTSRSPPSPNYTPNLPRHCIQRLLQFSMLWCIIERSHSWINWINTEVFICYVSLTN